MHGPIGDGRWRIRQGKLDPRDGTFGEISKLHTAIAVHAITRTTGVGFQRFRDRRRVELHDVRASLKIFEVKSSGAVGQGISTIFQQDPHTTHTRCLVCTSLTNLTNKEPAIPEHRVSNDHICEGCRTRKNERRLERYRVAGIPLFRGHTGFGYVGQRSVMRGAGPGDREGQRSP